MAAESDNEGAKEEPTVVETPETYPEYYTLVAERLFRQRNPEHKLESTRTGDADDRALESIAHYLETAGSFRQFFAWFPYKYHIKHHIGEKEADDPDRKEDVFRTEKALLELRALRERKTELLSLDNVLNSAYHCTDLFDMRATVVLAHEFGWLSGVTVNRTLDPKIAEMLQYMDSARELHMPLDKATEDIYCALFTFPRLYKEAAHAMHQKKYKEAREILEEIRNSNNNNKLCDLNGPLGYRLAQIAVAEKDYEKAEQQLLSVTLLPSTAFPVQYDVKEEDAYLAVAKLYYKKKEFTRIQEVLKRGFKQCTSHKQLLDYKKGVINDWYELGKKAAVEGDHPDARAYYRRVIQFEPEHIKAHLKIAESYEAQGGRLGEVRHFYDKVLALDPKNSFAREGLDKLKLK